MALALERRAFAGSARPVETFREGFVGDASFTGCIAFVSWERARVERLLPPTLELAPAAAGRPHADHPVAFVFGHQQRGAVMFAGIRVPMNVDFGEFALAIPFVRHRGSDRLHTYVARMLSSYFPAVWDGCIRYGYRKNLASMRWHDDAFVMTDEREALVFHALVEPATDWTSGERAPSLTGPLREAFALPIVGCKPNGRLVCAYWGWELDEALVRSAAARISIDGPLLPELSPQESYCASLTVGVRAMLWKLSLPLPCQT